jgi:hypothetical protein
MEKATALRRRPGDHNRLRGLRPMALRPLLSEELAFITFRDNKLSRFNKVIGFLYPMLYECNQVFKTEKSIYG